MCRFSNFWYTRCAIMARNLPALFSCLVNLNGYLSSYCHECLGCDSMSCGSQEKILLVKIAMLQDTRSDSRGLIGHRCDHVIQYKYNSTCWCTQHFLVILLLAIFRMCSVFSSCGVCCCFWCLEIAGLRPFFHW